MQIWSISYTSDKHKAKNRCWLQGKMNFIPSRGVAHFYDEDNVEIGKLKCGEEKIYPGAELSLWKHLVEIGELEAEEESVEAVLERLNRELGIEEFQEASTKRVKTNVELEIGRKGVTLKPKIPTIVSKEELCILYNVLMSRDTPQKKTKTWHDGLLKYHPTLKLAEFYDAAGKLVCKKVMEGVEEGQMIEGSGSRLLLEVISMRKSSDDELKPSKYGPGTKTTPISASSTSSTSNEPVHFSILYTTDKHKKSKKWLDGRCDFNASTKLACFFSEDSTACFYKKVMPKEMAAGDEFESGMYLFQIDEKLNGVLGRDDGKLNKVESKSATTNKVTSVVADENVPLNGQTNSVLLSILRSKTAELNAKKLQDEE